MTRKHYIALARAIREEYQDGTIQKGAIAAIAEVLWDDNHRFDWHRFAEACGIEESER